MPRNCTSWQRVYINVEKVTFAVLKKINKLNTAPSSFSILYIASHCPWGCLQAASQTPERIYETPGHPSEKKGCFPSWISQKVGCEKMPGSISQRQCADVFWQCCLWLMCSSAGCILLLCCLGDGVKSDNQTDRTHSFQLVIFLPGTQCWVLIKYFVHFLILCVCVCVFSCYVY